MIITIHVKFSLQSRRFLTDTLRCINRGRHLVVLTSKIAGLHYSRKQSWMPIALQNTPALQAR